MRKMKALVVELGTVSRSEDAVREVVKEALEWLRHGGQSALADAEGVSNRPGTTIVRGFATGGRALDVVVSTLDGAYVSVFWPDEEQR